MTLGEILRLHPELADVQAYSADSTAPTPPGAASSLTFGQILEHHPELSDVVCRRAGRARTD